MVMFCIPGCGVKNANKETEETEQRESQMRAGAAVQRQGDGSVRARHRPQPAGAQHRACARRTVRPLSFNKFRVPVGVQKLLVTIWYHA